MNFDEFNKKYADSVLESGFVSKAEIDECMSKADESMGLTLDKLLVQENILSRYDALRVTSAILGIPFVALDCVAVDPDAAKCSDRETSLKYCCVPLRFDDDRLVIATDFVADDKLEELKKVFGDNIYIYLALQTEVLSTIEELYPKSPAAEVKGITRYDVNEDFAHSGMIKAGNFYYLSYCVGNVGGTIEKQINGAFDDMERRLKLAGLSLANVIQMDCLFRDVWNIPVMERVIKERFNGRYPVRKSIQTNFAHVGGENGLLFQVDGIAYSEE